MKNGYTEIINGVERTWVAFNDESGYWIENKLKLFENIEKIPLNCPLCEIIMNGKHDTKCFLRYKCCERCYIQFIEGREEKWLAGGRPNEAQINSFREKRKKFFNAPLHKVDDVYIENTNNKKEK